MPVLKKYLMSMSVGAAGTEAHLQREIFKVEAAAVQVLPKG